MSFDIEGATQDVLMCEECHWCQTKKHFADGPSCTMCGGSGEKIDEVQPTVGMTDFKYRELLAALEEDADGVGAGTVENIEQHFEEGDDFLDAAEAAYMEVELSGLTDVDGVGNSSAKQIALTIADREDWDEGGLFVM
jgi:hypothetical protein